VNKIKIEKDIIVQDQYGVTRTVWLAGDEVEPYVYRAILKHNTVVNTEDLPEALVGDTNVNSLHNQPMEYKILDEVQEKPAPEVKQEEAKLESAPEEAVQEPVADKAPPKRKKRSAKPKKG
jgi:hypothetical protein